MTPGVISGRMPVVGVIGHHVLDHPAGLMASVDRALDRIGATLSGPVVLMASLSEGTDRLVVRRAFERLDVRTFVVPLPFTTGEVERGLEPESLGEFRRLTARARYVLPMPQPYGASRAEAFAEAGRFITARAHVMLVVWNGSPGRGDDPTGRVVDDARRCGLPIAWVHAVDGADPGAVAPACEPGGVTFEGW
jgi:hypothetical protein